MKKLMLISIVSGLLIATPIAGHALSQWASTVIDFSSQYSIGEWSAKQALNAKNVTTYGDNVKAWAPKRIDSRSEYLTLGFTTPVYASGLTVRETFGYGFVIAVDVIDTADVAHNVWSGIDDSLPNQINDFTVTWPTTSYLVKGVKIYIDTSIHTNDWEEIDAVQLHGIETLSGKIAPRLGHSAQLVCKNSTTNQTINTTIKGSGKTAPATKWDCEKMGLTFKVGDTVSVQITGKITE